jgi:hypothetical protein
MNTCKIAGPSRDVRIESESERLAKNKIGCHGYFLGPPWLSNRILIKNGDSPVKTSSDSEWGFPALTIAGGQSGKR